MKKKTAVFLAIVLFLSGVPARAAHTVSASSYILIEASTGRVLAAKEENTRRPMASTTKIMTALLALEEENCHERFVVDSEAIRVEGTSMGLKEGDEASLYDLAGGMLAASGNDGANAAAVKIAGSIEAFAEKMNEKAAALSMHNTHFVTPSGLHDEAHYSTAADMALLARAALKNEDFAALCSQKSVQLYYGNPPYTRTLSNHNRLLSSYSGCIGVKTGFTKKAGRCLVSAAERDGVTLICVTLNAPDDWADHTALFDYGFSAVQSRAVSPDVSDVSIPVAGGTSDRMAAALLSPGKTVLTEEEWKRVTRKIECPPFLYAPVQKGDAVGTAVYLLDGEEVCRIPLVAQESVQYDKTAQPPSLWKRIVSFLKEHIRFLS